MRVTSKGQVTIPKPIRDKLGVKPGDDVEFVERDGEVHVVPRHESESNARMDRRAQFAAAMKKWSGKGASGLTTSEYMKLVRPSDIPGALGHVEAKQDIEA